jgi:hypothetical protein
LRYFDELRPIDQEDNVKPLLNRASLVDSLLSLVIGLQKLPSQSLEYAPAMPVSRELPVTSTLIAENTPGRRLCHVAERNRAHLIGLTDVNGMPALVLCQRVVRERP